VLAASGHGVARPQVAAESRRAVLQDIAACHPCCSTPSSSSPATASPVPAFSNHPPARPTRPQAPPESLEPRRPLQRQPLPLLRPATSDSPPPEHRCRGEPLTVRFCPLQPLNRAPPLVDLLLDLFPHRPRRRLTGNLADAATPRHGGAPPLLRSGAGNLAPVGPARSSPSAQ
jgi:hypothetical protein